MNKNDFFFFVIAQAHTTFKIMLPPKCICNPKVRLLHIYFFFTPVPTAPSSEQNPIGLAKESSPPAIRVPKGHQVCFLLPLGSWVPDYTLCFAQLQK